MNAFVRDGAVNRRKRCRQSFLTRNIEQERKKIHKTDDDGTKAQSDLAFSTLRPNFDESTANQSTVVATQKESRFQNSEFMRSKAFLYLNYKKINSANVNKSLKEHLKQYDENETHLKRIFEQCYDVSKGSVEKSKAMMKQIETNTHVRLDLLPNSSSEVRNRLPISSFKVVQKTVKKCKNKKYKKKMPLLLRQRIDDKNLILFGNYNSKKDKKILYGKTIIPVVVPKIYNNYDDTPNPVSEHFESENNFCRITKSYSLYSKQNDSLRVTKVSKPSSDRIVPGNSISCKNNPVRYGKIKVPRLKMDVIAHNAKESLLEIVHDVEKMMFSQLKIDETVQDVEESTLIIDENSTVLQLIMDECVKNVKDSALEIVDDGEEIIIPQLKIDETVQDVEGSSLIIDENSTVPQLLMDECVKNVKDSALEIVNDGEEIIISQLKIDETVQDDEESALIIDENSTVPQLLMDECVKNVKDSALEIFNDSGEIIIPQLKIYETVQDDEEPALIIDENSTVPQLLMEECVKNVKDSALEIVNDGEETIIPQLKIDETVQDVDESALIIDENSTVPQLLIDECVKNVKDSALEIVNDSGETIIPQLKIDETVQDVDESALIIDENSTVPQLLIDECVKNVKDSALEIVNDSGETIIPQLKIDETVQDDEESALIIDENSTVPQLLIEECVKNVKDSALEIVNDGGEIIIPQLKMEGNNKNTKMYALDTNIDVGEIIDLESEKYTITPNTIDSQINKIENKNTNDMNQQSEILNYDVNIVLKIGNLIDPEDKVFKNSIIKDLATYFLNDDFLNKAHALWKTTESDLVGELVVKLLTMFNDTEYNMALFSGCLICIFREIARKSSIPPCKIKLKLIIFLDAIKKYIKFHDYELWRNWFLPSMFFDWCFIVAYTFMNTNNDFMIDLNKKSIIINATTYYKMVKQCKYFFINQDSKPIKSLKKKGIFELTRIDDLLEIDDVNSVKSNNTVIPNTSINISSTEPKHKKSKIDDRIETISHTAKENLEEVCPAPVNPRIYVNPKYNISNSFIKTLNWFNFDVTELRNKLNAVISNESIDSSIVVQNNVDDNILPLVGKLGSLVTSETNKSIKRKKSCTQVESPRVFFTIANDPKEFNITCDSSVVIQTPSSSAVPQNASLSKVPQNSSSLPICQSSNPSPICQNSSSSPQNSSSLSICQNFSSSTVRQNLSSWPQNASLSKIPQNSSSLPICQSSNPSPICQNSSSSPQNSSLSKVPQNSSSLPICQSSNPSPICQNSSSSPQNSSSLSICQNFSSSTIHQNLNSWPQNASLSKIPQNSSSLPICQSSNPSPICQNSSSSPQNSSSLSICQNFSSSTVRQNLNSWPQNASLSKIPQNSSSLPICQSSNPSPICQNFSSSTVRQNSSSWPQNASLSKIPQNFSSLPICQSSNPSPICQNFSSSTVCQNSSSLSICQNFSSSTVCQNSSSSPQNSSSLPICQNLSSSTILANNPEEMNTTYGSSKVPRNSSFSVTPINLNQHYNNILSNNTQFTSTLETVITRTSNSSTVPQTSDSSSVFQNSSLSTVPTNTCPYYNNNLINTQFPGTMQTVIHQTLNSSTVPQNVSPYYNNISSNYAHVSNSISISNATQTSNSRSTHLPVDINSQSSITTLPPVSSNKWPSNFYQQSTATNSQPLKAANTWPSNLYHQSTATNSKPLKAANTWPSNLYHQSTATNSQPLKAANTWPSNLYQQSTATNVQPPKATNTCQTNVTNTTNVYKNPCYDPSCCAYFKSYTDSAPSYFQLPYKENIPLTTTHPQLSNSCTYPTNNIQSISREVVGGTAASVAPIDNAYIQKLNEKYNNYNYGNSFVNQYGLQCSEHNPQVSPDLPDAQIPNMPNHQDSNTRNKTCMAANCTNISCFRCDSCMAVFYCGTQCQKSDWHYHKNECCRF